MTTQSLSLAALTLVTVGLITITPGPVGETFRTLGDLVYDTLERFWNLSEKLGVTDAVNERLARMEYTSKIERIRRVQSEVQEVLQQAEETLAGADIQMAEIQAFQSDVKDVLKEADAAISNAIEIQEYKIRLAAQERKEVQLQEKAMAAEEKVKQLAREAKKLAQAAKAAAKSNPIDLTIPYDAAAKLAYEASDKTLKYNVFKAKYEADAVADVMAKKMDLAVPYDAAAMLAYDASDKSKTFEKFKTAFVSQAVADVIAKTEAKRAEAERLAEEARQEEERKQLEEEKRLAAEEAAAAAAAEEARLLEEQKQLEAAAMEAAEQERLQRLEEEKRLVEEEQASAEEARLAEEERLAEELRLSDEERRAEEEKLAEEQRVAREERIAEVRRLAEESRLAEEREQQFVEEQRLASEELQAERLRVAEEERLAKEREERIADVKRRAEEARLAAEREEQYLEQQRLASEQLQAERQLLADEDEVAKLAALDPIDDVEVDDDGFTDDDWDASVDMAKGSVDGNIVGIDDAETDESQKADWDAAGKFAQTLGGSQQEPPVFDDEEPEEIGLDIDSDMNFEELARAAREAVEKMEQERRGGRAEEADDEEDDDDDFFSIFDDEGEIEIGEDVPIEDIAAAARRAVEMFESDMGPELTDMGEEPEMFFDDEVQEEAPPMEASSDKNWAGLTVLLLKEELKSRGLSAIGKKVDLVARLEENDRELALSDSSAENDDESEEEEDEDDDDDEDDNELDIGGMDLEEIGRLAREAAELFNGEEPSDEVLTMLENEEIELMESMKDTGDVGGGSTKAGSDYSSMNMSELKDELRNRGLKVSGKKADLIERLESSD